ncbi:alpha/beta hydrolase [Mycolicibacterium sp. 141076]|uniref:alpha/beta fold hydrolase n=1 Tax=Mycobacteriaceae TaxID=1762 RepID=UPI00092B4FD8|nr:MULTISPECIES: alpha/beta hydrolase [Mycolicibacterium]MDX1877919.1 alpha/beta hydrolase [Mycolicibacterium sp. 141076]UCZ58120.1 alpha/beta hydrolase [Mycolicibacterium phocaicum]SHX07751.1 alpha/beta hydrolase [Mycobacteroides abscessus subsp. abscessus]
MVMSIDRPKLEGNIAVGEDRQIGFAEFGDPQGRAVFWLHGTPGARRQIPTEARAFAAQKNIRLIGIDRPGIGSSTPYQYENVLGFTEDLRTIADTLGINRFAVIGLSGGGPYTLATASAMPDRVVMAAVLGGVAPLIGEDGISSGLMELAKIVRPIIEVADTPIRWVAGSLIKVIAPFGSPALDLYARISPDGDRNLLSRPEFKAMFLDDLLNGSRKQLAAPFADIVVFARDWGFRLADITVPVRWWHGDADHIVPYAHGQHAVARIADAEMYTLPGESHLAGLGVPEDILTKILEVWDADLAAQ